ncbi:MAG: hypothetical protein HYT06_01705 [Candidatus Levybacteria bacterium]|nr:hypothetical protein [Candidatus Levybacteria bacterium]
MKKNSIKRSYPHGGGLFWQKAISGAAIIIAAVGILGIFQNEVRNIFWSASAPLMLILREKAKSAAGFFSPILSIAAITQENSNL